MKVDNNALKGQFGEAYVSSLLAGECLVRPTASLDIGIDLYCETVRENRPFLHFWVQVKTGKIEVDESGLSANFRFTNRHLEYWDKQPVPVFAALVPTAWPVESPPTVYVIDITSARMENKRRVSMTSDYVWSPGDRQSVVDFLEKVVPETTAKLLLKHGVVGKIPSLEQTRAFRVASELNVLDYQQEIRTQVRRSSAWPIIYLHRRGELGKMTTAFKNRLGRALTHFVSGWDSTFAKGLLEHHDGNFESALSSYRRSVEILDTDSQFREEIGKEQSDEMYQMLRAYINMAENEEPLRVV